MTGTLRTGVLMAGMVALFMGVGYMIGGEAGMMLAFMVALGMNAFAFWNSDKMVLRMHGARAVDERSAPDLVGLVRVLAQRAGLPMPAVYIMDQAQPNAFATGRSPSHAAVAVTTGLMRTLNSEELAGVIAHELAHIKNRDTLIMTITATIAGAISMLANFAMFFGNSRNSPLGLIGLIAIMILAPIAAMLVQMAISRSREYEADRIGAEISGRPEWLASALDKIGRGAKAIDNEVAENHPATAHLFIANPLHARSIDGLFTTHPPMEKRIAKLRAMAMPGAAAAGAGPWS